MAHIGGGSLPLLVTVGRGEQRWREIEPSLVGCGGGGHRHLAGVPNLYQVLSHSFVIKFIQYPITSFGYIWYQIRFDPVSSISVFHRSVRKRFRLDRDSRSVVSCYHRGFLCNSQARESICGVDRDSGIPSKLHPSSDDIGRTTGQNHRSPGRELQGDQRAEDLYDGDAGSQDGDLNLEAGG